MFSSVGGVRGSGMYRLRRPVRTELLPAAQCERDEEEETWKQVLRIPGAEPTTLGVLHGGALHLVLRSSLSFV